MIECNVCFQKFEFSEKERNWFAEMGFKDPKKCKKCKGHQKNKKTYTYTPSAKELHMKELMKNAEKKNKVSNKVMNKFDILSEEDVKEVVSVEVKKRWADDDEGIDWSKPIKWCK